MCPGGPGFLSLQGALFPEAKAGAGVGGLASVLKVPGLSLPSQGQQAAPAPRKAAGSRDIKHVWVMQTACGSGSANTNEKHMTCTSPLLAARTGFPGQGGEPGGPGESSARC